MRLPILSAAGMLLAAWGIAACGSDSAAVNSPGGPWLSTDAGSTASDIGATPTPPVDAGLPPEVEERRAFETPQAGARFVYVANPRRDNVAVIDSQTLAITSVEAGDGPTYLATVPGRDEALVINVNASTATLLRTTTAGTTTVQMPVVGGANAIAIAPGGHYAVVYLDTTQPNQGVPAGSFQEIAVLRLDPGMERGLLLSVGFRPVDVTFSADGETGFVITEETLGAEINGFARVSANRLLVLAGRSVVSVDPTTGAAATATPVLDDADGIKVVGNDLFVWKTGGGLRRYDATTGAETTNGEPFAFGNLPVYGVSPSP